MRIFIAILLPKLIKDQIYSDIEKLSSGFKGNYSSYDNLHLTMYYIGEVDDLQLKRIVSEIKKINFKKFDFEIGKIGSFKNSSSQRLVHLQVKPNNVLKSLHQQIIFCLKNAGVSITSTDFTPHITLGRKVEISLEALYSLVTEEMIVSTTRISVMESKRIDNVLVYEEVDFQILK